MQPGAVVDGRFEIERAAKRGGVGSVYRARDLTTGTAVALKLLHLGDDVDERRFAREAAVLERLGGAAVVRYVAHGRALGVAYLATEWLDGEDLAERLEHDTLTVAESLDLAQRVAEALAPVHKAGVVHRDIKPSNLFLEGGDLARVKIIDFGIVRQTADAQRFTGAGVLVGTPGYMAPEQARGAARIDARADVFALGCVLFECLAGRPAFEGDHPMEILAKTLDVAAPPLASVRPDVSPAIEALVGRMLAGVVEHRPRDASVVAADLRALGDRAGGRPPRGAGAAPAIGRAEQRLFTIALVAIEPGETGSLLGETRLRDAAIAAGASLERLAEGVHVALTDGPGGPRHGAPFDKAARAARMALAFRAALPDAPMALATGRAAFLGRHLVGEVIERGVRTLGGAGNGAIRVDGVTAVLLEDAFVVEPSVARPSSPEAPRSDRDAVGKPPLDRDAVGKPPLDRDAVGKPPLDRDAVGKPPDRPGPREPGGRAAPELHRERSLRELFERRSARRPAGRERELASLELSFAACRTDARARAAAVVGGPGTGKSALVAELGRRLATEGRVTFLAAAQSPASLVELDGDDAPIELDAAIGAATAERPLLVLVDDLGALGPAVADALVVARRTHASRPWFLVVAARPEAHEDLVRGAAMSFEHELRLGPLPRRASAELCRAVLGHDAAEPDVEAVVALAAGDPVLLRELSRSARKGQAPSDVVLGLASSRFDGLSADARRAMRAASLFGQRFWSEGVRALLGQDTTLAVDDWLDELVAADLCSRTGSGHPAGGTEYAFAGDLVRRAALASLTDADRELGERLAKAWHDKTGAVVGIVS